MVDDEDTPRQMSLDEALEIVTEGAGDAAVLAATRQVLDRSRTLFGAGGTGHLELSGTAGGAVALFGVRTSLSLGGVPEASVTVYPPGTRATATIPIPKVGVTGAGSDAVSLTEVYDF